MRKTKKQGMIPNIPDEGDIGKTNTGSPRGCGAIYGTIWERMDGARYLRVDFKRKVIYVWLPPDVYILKPDGTELECLGAHSFEEAEYQILDRLFGQGGRTPYPKTHGNALRAGAVSERMKPDKVDTPREHVQPRVDGRHCRRIEIRYESASGLVRLCCEGQDRYHTVWDLARSGIVHDSVLGKALVRPDRWISCTAKPMAARSGN